MTTQAKGWFLLVAHLLLVGSVAAKYAWERHTCPRVWTRATQYDPEQPLRGRYLALTLHADVCGLRKGRDGDQFQFDPESREHMGTPARSWDVSLVARNGVLTAVEGDKEAATQTEELTLPPGLPCTYGSLTEGTDFFIAEHAQTPFPLAKGQELWAEVTVPPSGPPRPIQLAVSDGKSFRVLALR